MMNMSEIAVTKDTGYFLLKVILYIEERLQKLVFKLQSLASMIIYKFDL